MKETLSKKSVGFYFIILAGVIGIVSVIRFLMWAPRHSGMDAVIVAALILGILVDVILMVKDNDYLTILGTICYTIATVKLLTNSVGSFVDSFQGINMFGDASQVGTIVSISAVMAVSILLSILAGFVKREKE